MKPEVPHQYSAQLQRLNETPPITSPFGVEMELNATLQAGPGERRVLPIGILRFGMPGRLHG